jgi:hypothetical protein
VTSSLPTPDRKRRSPASLAPVAMIAAAALAGCGGSSNSHSPSSTTTSSTSSSASAPPTAFTAKAFASGIPITIKTPSGTVSINQPDDITNVGSNIFVGFQNGVNPDGTPTPKGTPGTGGTLSTVVEFSSSGSPVQHWNISGHVDGLTADPSTGKVIATTDEDGNAHLFVLDPSSPQAVEYKVPALAQHGGFDAISFWKGMMLISASAPGTSGGKAPPQASYPAVFVVTLNSSAHKVSVRPLFLDGAAATKANGGQSGTTHLALTDPDSNFAVPTSAQRFGGQFELNSQGDLEQIFVADTSGKKLSVLKESQAIDDSAWPTDSTGALYVTESSSDLIWKVTGPWKPGSEIVAVAPCNANSAPTACPVPPKYPNNSLGEINQSTGAVTNLPASVSKIQAKGLDFVP